MASPLNFDSIFQRTFSLKDPNPFLYPPIAEDTVFETDINEPIKGRHPSDTLRQTLIEKGFIDEYAEPTDALMKIPVPELPPSTHTHLKDFNHKLRIIRFKDKNGKEHTFSYTLGLLFNQVKKEASSEKSLEIVGSAVFWLLGKRYFEELLITLGIEKSRIPAEFLDTLRFPPNDQDLRFTIESSIDFDKMEKLKKTFIAFFSRISNSNMNERSFIENYSKIKNGAFRKLFHCRDPHYCIVSPKDYENTEISIVAWLKRNHLFSHDALKININTLLDNNHNNQPHLLTDLSSIWKPLLHRLLMIIDADEIQTINEMGYPLYISYLTKGRICLKQKFEEEIVKNFINLAAKKGLFYTLFENTQKVFRNHHGLIDHLKDDPAINTIPIYTINLIQSLFRNQVDEIELIKIRNTIVGLMPKTEAEGIPHLLKRLLENPTMTTKHLLALLQIFFFNALKHSDCHNAPLANKVYLREHCGRKALQVKLISEPDTATLLLDFDLQNALNTIQEDLPMIDEECRSSLKKIYNLIMPSSSTIDEKHPLGYLFEDIDAQSLIQSFANPNKAGELCQFAWILDLIPQIHLFAKNKNTLKPLIPSVPDLMKQIQDPLRRTDFLSSIMSCVSPKHPSEQHIKTKGILANLVDGESFDETLFFETWIQFLISSRHEKTAFDLLDQINVRDWLAIYNLLIANESPYIVRGLKQLFRSPKINMKIRIEALQQMMMLVMKSDHMLPQTHDFTSLLLDFLIGKWKKTSSKSNPNFLLLTTKFIEYLTASKFHELSFSLLKLSAIQSTAEVSKQTIQNLWIQLFVAMMNDNSSGALNVWIEGALIKIWEHPHDSSVSQQFNISLLHLLEGTDPQKNDLLFHNILIHIDESNLNPEQKAVYTSLTEKYVKNKRDIFEFKLDNIELTVLKTTVVRQQVIELTQKLQEGATITEELLKTFKRLIKEGHSDLTCDEINAFINAVCMSLLKPRKSDHENTWRLNRLKNLMTATSIFPKNIALPELSLKFLRSAWACRNPNMLKDCLQLINIKIDLFIDPARNQYSPAQIVEFFELSLHIFNYDTQNKPLPENIKTALIKHQDFLYDLFLGSQRPELVIDLSLFLKKMTLFKPTQSMCSIGVRSISTLISLIETDQQLHDYSAFTRLFLQNSQSLSVEVMQSILPILEVLFNRYFKKESYSIALSWINEYIKIAKQLETSIESFLLKSSQEFILKNRLEETFTLFMQIDVSTTVLEGYSQALQVLVSQFNPVNDSDKIIELLEKCPLTHLQPMDRVNLQNFASNFLYNFITTKNRNSSELSRCLNLMLRYEILSPNLWEAIIAIIAESPFKNLKEGVWGVMIEFVDARNVFAQKSDSDKETTTYLNALNCLQVCNPKECLNILKSRQSGMKKTLAELIPINKYDTLFTILAFGALNTEGDISNTLLDVMDVRQSLTKYRNLNTPLMTGTDLFLIESFLKSKDITYFFDGLNLLVSLLQRGRRELHEDEILISKLIVLYEIILDRVIQHSKTTFLDPNHIEASSRLCCYFLMNYTKYINFPKSLELLFKTNNQLEISIRNRLFLIIEGNPNKLKDVFLSGNTSSKLITLLNNLIKANRYDETLYYLQVLTKGGLIPSEKLSKTWLFATTMMLSDRFAENSREYGMETAHAFMEIYPHLYGTDIEIPTVELYFNYILNYCDTLNENSNYLLLKMLVVFDTTVKQTVLKLGDKNGLKTISTLQKNAKRFFNSLNDNLYPDLDNQQKVSQALHFEYLFYFLEKTVIAASDHPSKFNRFFQSMGIINEIFACYPIHANAPENLDILINCISLVVNAYEALFTKIENSKVSSFLKYPKIVIDELFISMSALRSSSPVSDLVIDKMSHSYLAVLNSFLAYPSKNIAITRTILESGKNAVLNCIEVFSKMSAPTLTLVVNTYFQLKFPCDNKQLWAFYLNNCREILHACSNKNVTLSSSVAVQNMMIYIDPEYYFENKKTFPDGANTCFYVLFHNKSPATIIQAVEILKVINLKLYESTPLELFNLIDLTAQRIDSDSLYDQSNTPVFETLFKPFLYVDPSKKIPPEQEKNMTSAFNNVLKIMDIVPQNRDLSIARAQFEKLIALYVNTLLAVVDKNRCNNRTDFLKNMIESIYGVMIKKRKEIQLSIDFLKRQDSLIQMILEKKLEIEDSKKKEVLNHAKRLAKQLGTL